MPVVLMGWRPLSQLLKVGQVTDDIMPHKSASALYRKADTKSWAYARSGKKGYLMFKPLLPWIGGKRKLAPCLLPLFPNHTCYVEPFCGAAALFFMKEPSDVEVLNDINGELVNLYRVVKNHLEELYKQFKWALTSRQNYQWLLDTKPETLTDVQRAARFLYLQKLAFGGKVEGQTFGTSATSRPRFNIFSLEQDLSDTHFRLSKTLIEHLPWERIIEKYDRNETLFYCDPPYWQTEGYGVEFPFDNYERMADYAKTIKGKMIISINDHPEIRMVFDGMFRREVDYKYTLNGSDNPCQCIELIYGNWQPDEHLSGQVHQESLCL